MKEVPCPECEGAGWVGKLYPSGHTEATCDTCSGEGFFEEECTHKYTAYVGLMERFEYCIYCDEKIQ